MDNAQKKPWYKKWWIWLIIVIVIIGLAGAVNGDDSKTDNTQQPASNNDSAQPQPQEEIKTEEQKVTLAEFYEKIQNGQSKTDVNTLAGEREPTNCSESQNEYIGKMEICSYGGFADGGIVTVTFTNEKVTNKSKNEF